MEENPRQPGAALHRRWRAAECAPPGSDGTLPALQAVCAGILRPGSLGQSVGALVSLARASGDLRVPRAAAL